jgi:hypothetical protein
LLNITVIRDISGRVAMTGLAGGALAASAAASPYVIAAFGLIGSLIGGGIAGTVSLVVAGKARNEARRGWIRDNRRQIYASFLASAQRLLTACEELGPSKDAASTVKQAYFKLFEPYVVVQTVADWRVVDSSRVHLYRLMKLEELKLEALNKGAVPENYALIVKLSRESRHATIDAMREELGLAGSVNVSEDFDPFAGTDLEGTYPVGPYSPDTGYDASG